MTLRHRILMLCLVAVAGMFFALWLQYRSFSAQFQAIEAVTRNVKAVVALSYATHQLQRERGLTAIANSKADDQALAEQVRNTDAALSALSGTGIDIALLGESIAQLRVTARTITPLAVIDGYCKLLQRLVDEMGRLTRTPDTAVAKTELTAYPHVVAAKEYLGQIRAMLGYWIEHNDPLVLNSLVRLKSLYDEHLRRFHLEASPVMLETLAAQLSGQEVERTFGTVTHVATTGRLPHALDVQTWWSMSTAAIDHLKVVEDRSLELIETKAREELAQLRSSMRLGVIATLAGGLAVLLLAVSATATLLRALDRALSSMELIAASQDFRSRIPDDSPDEIGRISRSFNQLLGIAERLLKEKDFLAATDPLTGINNRLRFAKVLREEADRKRRSKTPMALIMLDVDYFKRINDTHGHNVGDEVLKTLTNLVSNGIRAIDFFGRWGGEEFVLLLRDDDCGSALAVAEKLRQLIAGADFPVVGKLTCSFGVAAWEQDDTEASLVARADKALYASKEGGRNLVSCVQGVGGSCPGRQVCVQ